MNAEQAEWKPVGLPKAPFVPKLLIHGLALSLAGPVIQTELLTWEIRDSASN